jgi:putative thioredoxin
MTAPDIIEVNEETFDYQVIAYSQNIPVIVDFWADWCQPCRRMGEVLEQAARQHRGQFRLAKVNVDQNLRLTRRYQIHTVPAQRVFEGGRVVGQLSGTQPDARLREFVHQMIPGPENLLLEKAASLLDTGNYREVIEVCQDLQAQGIRHPRGMYYQIKAYLHLGQPEQAQVLLNRFPAHPLYQKAEAMQPLITALLEEPIGPPETGRRLDAVYARALRLITMDNLPAALDGLLEVLSTDKDYRGGTARQIVLGLFELLGDDHPLTREYRPRLANILF